MAWLAGGYTKRKALKLTGGASGALTDHQLKITVSYAAAMQGDFDDLRFTQADGTTLVDAWAEVIVADTSAVVWVEFPTTPANTVEQTYYMYYGNAAAASDWDIAATFLFGDDFLGASLDTGKWSSNAQGTASFTVANGVCEIDQTVADSGSTYYAYLRTLSYNPPNDVIIETGFKWMNNNAGTGYSQTSPIFLSDGGGAPILPYATNSQFMVSEMEYYPLYTKHQSRNSESWGSEDNIYTTVLSADTKYIAKAKKLSTGIDWYLLNSSRGVLGSIIGNTDAPTNIDYPLSLACRLAKVEYDWVLVRKYVANPPTYEFGSEEDETPTLAAPTSIFYGPFVGPLGGAI